MASFDQMYQMMLAQQNPMINVQNIAGDMPSWLSAPAPPNPLQGVDLLTGQMNQIGQADRARQQLGIQQQRADQERERARALADVQMQTFQAEQANLAQKRQARENYAAENPEFAGAIMAGKEPTTFQRQMALVGNDLAKHREVFGPGSGAEVSVNMPGQITEEQKIVGKAYGQDYVDLQRGGRQAYQDNAKLDQLNNLLDETYTGAGADKILAGKKAMQMLGMDVEGVGEAEAAKAIASELALQLRNPAGGAGMPGAMSDKDREFLQSMTPGLAMSPDGRKALIDTKQKINQRNIDVAKMARDYRKKNGSLDEVFFDELAAYSEENPMFETQDAGITVDQTALDAEMKRRGLQ